MQLILEKQSQNCLPGLPCGSVVKTLPANAGDMGLIPGLGRPTCHGATKPMCYDHWIYALEPRNRNSCAHVLQLLKPSCLRARALQQEKPLPRGARSPKLEKSQWRNSNQAPPKISKIIFLKNCLGDYTSLLSQQDHMADMPQRFTKDVGGRGGSDSQKSETP